MFLLSVQICFRFMHIDTGIDYDRTIIRLNGKARQIGKEKENTTRKFPTDLE